MLPCAATRAEVIIQSDTSVDGTTLTVSPSGYLLIDGASAPTLTLTGGATTSGAEATIVGGTQGGQLVIAGGSVMTNTGSGLIGFVGTNHIFGGTAHIGIADGSTGTAIVSGAGSFWDAGLSFWVGNGEIHISEGGRVESAYAYLGKESRNGTATISGTGSIWATYLLYVGHPGNGEIQIRDGGRLTAYDLNAASLTGAVGAITVSGAAAQVTLTNALDVGIRGVGTLTIGGGASAAAAWGSLGLQADGMGTGTIAGVGSALAITNTYFVGHTGTGNLTLRDGARGDSAGLTIGLNATGTGQVTVTGPGSQWTATGQLRVGRLGTGVLNVRSGGAVTSGTAFIGHSLDSSGAVVVSDTGSRWTVTNNLYIGGHETSSAGAGALTVGGGAEVTVGDTLKLWNNGTLTLDGGHVTARNFDVGVPWFHFHGGTVTVSGGTYTHIAAANGGGFLVLDGDGAVGSPTIELTHGAELVGAQAMVIGADQHNGRLEVTGGSAVDTTKTDLVSVQWGGWTIYGGEAHIALNPGSFGSAYVAGPNSVWTVGRNLYVGARGIAGLVVEDGGRVNADHAFLGFVGAFGSATIAGTNSVWSISNGLIAGYSSAEGRLQIHDGGRVENLYGVLANDVSAIATATVRGSGSEWRMNMHLIVGDVGIGALNVENGGRIVSDHGYLGHNYYGFGTAGQGSATVTGAGSVWTMTNNLLVGNSGTGTLNVAQGGKVSSNFMTLGHDSPTPGRGGYGTVTVADENSQLSVTTQLRIGNLGSGFLTVSDGGTVVSGSGFLGYFTAGTVMITGADSRWTVTNNLYVGGRESVAGGYGLLTVADGGTVAVGGLTKVWNTGSLTISSGGTLQTGTLEIIAGGRLSVAPGASLSYDHLVVQDGGTFAGNLQTSGTLVLNGTLQGNATVQSGDRFGGSGIIDGIIAGAGTLGPGNSPGVLDVEQVDPSGGLDFLFEFTAANAIPDYLNRTASVNDVLHVTHATDPFLAALTPANTISFDFQVAQLNDGDVFYGGFFTNLPGDDFYGDGTIDDALYNFLVNGSALNPNHWQFTVTTVLQDDVDFGMSYGGIVDGRVMRIEAMAIPEPGSLLLMGAAAAGWYAR